MHYLRVGTPLVEHFSDGVNMAVYPLHPKRDLFPLVLGQSPPMGWDIRKYLWRGAALHTRVSHVDETHAVSRWNPTGLLEGAQWRRETAWA